MKKTLWNFSEYLPKVTGIWCANASGKARNFLPFSVFFHLFCRDVRHLKFNLKRKSVIGNEKYFQTFVLVRVQTILVWVFWVTAIRISVSYEIELSVAELKRVRIIHAPCKNDRGRPICQMDFFWNLKTNLKSIATARQSPPLFLLVTKSLYSPLYQYSTYVHTENPKWVGVNFNKKYWVEFFLSHLASFNAYPTCKICQTCQQQTSTQIVLWGSISYDNNVIFTRY